MIRRKYKKWIVIEFLKDLSFPIFSVKKGERWTAQCYGRCTQYYKACKGEIEDFEFASGMCLSKNIKLIYYGDDGYKANYTYRVDVK